MKKYLLLIIAFTLSLLNGVYASNFVMTNDSTKEFKNCTLINLSVSKIEGYEYSIGKSSPLKVSTIYINEFKDSICINEMYINHKFNKNDINETDFVNIKNDLSKIYLIDKKYNIKLSPQSLAGLIDYYFKIYEDLPIPDGFPCEFHIVNNKKFIWKTGPEIPKDRLKVISKCKNINYKSFWGIGDINNIVVAVEIFSYDWK